jgi:DNA-binding beta-propeller fold protein YncE
VTGHGSSAPAEIGRRLRRLARAGCLAVAALFLVACTGAASLRATRPTTDLQWPQQSDGPRIVWIKEIADYRDAGVTKGFWRRTLEFFTGKDDRAIVRPHGVLFDDRERLIITDPGAGIVHIIDTREGRYTVIGTESGAPLKTPIGVTEDDDDHLYLTDSTEGILYVYDLKDRSLRPFIQQKLQRPTGIAYNWVNRLLYVVETTAPRVVAFDSTGKEQLRFGAPGAGPDQFNHPTDITVDSQGQLYVTDVLNYKIKVFTPEGTPVSQFGTAGDAPGNLSKPKGIAVDSTDHIYVTDAMQDTVQVFDDSGRLLINFGATGVHAGEFWMPSGICIDQNDYIFVADTYNRRVQLFRYLPGTGSGTDAGIPDREKTPPGRGK